MLKCNEKAPGNMKVFSIYLKTLSILADLHVPGSLLQNKMQPQYNLNVNKHLCSLEILQKKEKVIF